MSVLLNDNARPASELGWPSLLNHPRHRPDQSQLPGQSTWPLPRAIFTLSKIAVEIWCISDLLEHLPDKPEHQSSSERKIEQLPRLFVGQPVDFVVAVGTAAFPSETSHNGSVVVGTKIFMHNADPDNPNSRWSVGPFDTILDSTLDKTGFDLVAAIDSHVFDLFLVAPLNPALKGGLIADYGFVGLGSVNVTDYKKYAQADKATLDAYMASQDPNAAKSLETTHGLIRVQSQAPFVFVSGVADRVEHFGDEVSPRSYAQNTTAAHNAGVILAWMIPKINSLL